MKYLALLVAALASSFASAAKKSGRSGAKTTFEETIRRRTNRTERRRRLKGSVPFPIILENNGLIVIEAESTPVQAPWVLGDSYNLRGFTGHGYYKMTGNDVSSGRPNGRLRYGLRIVTPGTYRFLMRGHKNFSRRGAESNSVYTKIVGYDGEKGDDLRTYLDGERGTGRSNEWIWGATHDLRGYPSHATYNFDTPGIYEFQISGLARDFHLDRLVFFKTDHYRESYVTGLSLLESSFLSISAPTTNPSFDAHVAYLSLIDSDTNKILAPYAILREHVTFDLAKLPRKLNILAFMGGSQTPRSVRFELNGRVFRTENGTPWALAGDNGRGDFLDWTPTVGNHNRLVVTPYSESGGRGRTGTPCILIFNVIDSSKSPPTPVPTYYPTDYPTDKPTKAPVRAPVPSTLQILKLSLVDADKDEVIPAYHDLQSGAVFDLSKLPRNLNILAIATTGARTTPRSVVFDLNGRKTTENDAPWAMVGDVRGDFKPWNPTANTYYTLTVMPFSEESGRGRAGIPKTITFHTIDGRRYTPPTSYPTYRPTKAPTRRTRPTPPNPPRPPRPPSPPKPTNRPTKEPTSYPTYRPTKAPTRRTRPTPPNPPKPPSPPSPSPPAPAVATVTKFYLVNAEDNTDMLVLTDGMTIVLAHLRTTELNIRAEVSGPVDKVSFNNGRTESNAPYSYFGDKNGDFDSYTPRRHERLYIVATPFDRYGRAGVVLGITVTFV